VPFVTLCHSGKILIPNRKGDIMDIDKTAELCKALGDKSRLLILKSLNEKPQYLEELSNRINLAASTISFHLKKLEKAGLVWKEKQQYYTIFYPKQELLELTISDLLNFEYEEEKMQDERIQKYKEKILKAFMVDGYIVQIPAQKQKRWIVFEQILNKFEFGRDYPEREVNEIIKQFNEDYCQIRRTFIEERVMERDSYVYRITQSYEDFRNGKPSESMKHGLKESFEQSIKAKFGVN